MRERKEEEDYSRLLGGRFIKQGHLLWGSSWATAAWVVFCTHLPNLKSLCGALNRIQACWIHIVSPLHYYVRTVTLGQLPGVGKASDSTFQSEWGDSSCSGPACRSNQRSTLLMTFPNTGPWPCTLTFSSASIQKYRFNTRVLCLCQQDSSQNNSHQIHAYLTFSQSRPAKEIKGY